MLVHFGSTPTLIASSADAAREIMKTHDLTFADRPELSVSRRLLYNFKDISAAPYGEYWRQLKSICVIQLLSNKRVQSFHSIRAEETSLLMDKIRESSCPVNLSDMVAELTNDVVCRAALGRKYREGEIGKKFLIIIREFVELIGNIIIGDYVPCLSWINRVNGIDARVDRVAKEQDDFLEGVIRERMETSNGKALLEEKTGENFLDILLDIYQNNTTGVSIDRDSIKAIILDAFAAGTDTTSVVLEWAMAELLRYPTIMKKLQQEIREIVEDRQEITYDDLEKMNFLKAIIKETLRCHMPIPLLVPRIARNDVKIMGYNISAMHGLLAETQPLGMNQKNFGLRFLNSSVDFRGQDFELIPFGAGRRICPGIAFAIATEELVLANLVHQFDWRLPDGADGKDLDMTEQPGLAIHRAVPLRAVATPHS